MVDLSRVSPVKSLVSTVNDCCGVVVVCLGCLLNALAEVEGGSVTKPIIRRLATTVIERRDAIIFVFFFDCCAV